MAPALYLLHVNSRPNHVSNKLWEEWYIAEHLPDLVNSKTSIRATFYEEIPTPASPTLSHPRKFLALYQTDFPESLETRNYKDLRTTSELFKKEDAGDGIAENGDFDARNYKLIQAYDPREIGETPSPEILTVEMYPENPEDFDKWYREEHLDLFSKLPGYRRSLRYRIGPKTPLTKDDDPPSYLAIHEVDNLETALTSKEAAASFSTPWTQKQLTGSKVFVSRGWKLVHSEGF